jgi:hypothetical protein
VTKAPSRPVLRLDIFIEILPRTPVYRGQEEEGPHREF